MPSTEEREMGADSGLLTTGKAAELLGVTPDTVLRWIKQGRLRARRTAGGHHRILLEDIEALIPDRRTSDTPVPSSECTFEPLHCWEYLNPHGETRDECRGCIVYSSRATRCFRLAELPDEVGHSKLFCHTTCEECAYYRRVKRLATKVLVITTDQGVVSRLENDPRDTLSIHYASDMYEASAAIGEHRPGIVVLDWDLDRVGAGELLERLASDIRVPGLRIIVAVRKSHSRPKVATHIADVLIGVLEKPFDARCIEALSNCVPIEAISTPRDSEKLPSGLDLDSGPSAGDG
jgi:excisionase family DNA binding protein